jgi:hypothetical protein
MRRVFLLLTTIALALAFAACAETDDTPDAGEDYDVSQQPDDAAAMFAAPQDGDTVTSPFQVEMTAEGVEIVPAGEPVAGEGHFHINVDIGCVPEGDFIPGPSDEATAQGHRHFGTGVTEAELELEPGTYELCLQLADGVHQAFGETHTITITVE